MSLRAIGEGNISSIVFRRGIIDAGGKISFDPAPRYAYSARPLQNRLLEKEAFLQKLRSHGLDERAISAISKKLPEQFCLARLKKILNELRDSLEFPSEHRRTSSAVLWIAQANYELRFPADCMPSEIVIFPATQYERQGMEDVRLVRFVDDDGAVRYFGTYTAFDGMRICPMLLETSDFCTFGISTLSGRYARNKGMALFPRRVGGQYLMLSRHDGENLFLLRSGDLHVWDASEKILCPAEEWDLLLVGNCGSPLETEAGWIVLTHGVGPMRQYSVGAILLDRDRPQRVLGRLRRPLLVPTAGEREGYVPNVVYSCGSMIYRGRLIIPYAVADSRTAFATVSVKGLIRALLASGP